MIIRVAATRLAVLGLYIFAALESIIIPIPADPLLVATVLAQPKRWRQLALGCTLASVIGGVVGWALGKFKPLSPRVACHVTGDTSDLQHLV